MRNLSYQQLVEHLNQCRILAETAQDPAIRKTAADLAEGYRKRLSEAGSKQVHAAEIDVRSAHGR